MNSRTDLQTYCEAAKDLKHFIVETRTSAPGTLYIGGIPANKEPRLRVAREDFIAFFKRNIKLARAYYENPAEFNKMQGSIVGQELACRMREELGYSRNSFWWDIVHWRGDYFRIASAELQNVTGWVYAPRPEDIVRVPKEGLRWKNNFTPPTEQYHKFGPDSMVLDGNQDFEFGKGDFTMEFWINKQPKEEKMDARPMTATERAKCDEATPIKMTVKRHKQITDLAYKLKAVMQKEMPNLQENELCMLGDMMRSIGTLKP